MLDIDTTDLIPLSTVPRLLPTGADGQPFHPSTATRWALYGIGGVKLKSLKLAGRRFTTREWLGRFLEEYRTRRSDSAPSPRSDVSPAPARRPAR